jgi:hemerythrin-like metal-binding protein
MQQIKWCEEYSVGIPEMDAQHRRMIELLGGLVKFTDSGGVVDPLTVLAEVNRYAEQHLQQEELLLRVRGYPGYTEHKAEHDAYRKKVAALQARAAKRDFGIAITAFLVEWWRSHILTSDQQYARFFDSQPVDPVTVGDRQPDDAEV